MPGPDPFYGLQPEFAANLLAFMGAAPMPLSIVSGYRSPEHQADLFNAAVAKYGSPEAARKWVAPPGHSMHNLGEAVDLGYGGGKLGGGETSLIDWAHQNAARYNLAFPMSYENWHIEPIGARAPVNAPDPSTMTSPSAAADPGSAEGAAVTAQPAFKTWMDYLHPETMPNGSNDPLARLFGGQNPFGDNPLRSMVFGALGKMFG